MKFEDIMRAKVTHEFGTIHSKCTQFIREAEGLPLIKHLSPHYNNIQKVKVRQKNNKSIIENTINEAFADKTFNLSNRAIFAYPNSCDDEGEPFYIFPIDGYKFLYCSEVRDSSIEHKHLLESLISTVGNPRAALETAKDVIRFTYTDKNLREGILDNAEIIIYNIPYYYAVRCSYTNNYKDILG